MENGGWFCGGFGGEFDGNNARMAKGGWRFGGRIVEKR
jgi:hypothetical protein